MDCIGLFSSWESNDVVLMLSDLHWRMVKTYSSKHNGMHFISIPEPLSSHFSFEIASDTKKVCTACYAEMLGCSRIQGKDWEVICSGVDSCPFSM